MSTTPSGRTRPGKPFAHAPDAAPPGARISCSATSPRPPRPAGVADLLLALLGGPGVLRLSSTRLAACVGWQLPGPCAPLVSMRAYGAGHPPALRRRRAGTIRSRQPADSRGRGNTRGYLSDRSVARASVSSCCPWLSSRKVAVGGPQRRSPRARASTPGFRRARSGSGFSPQSRAARCSRGPRGGPPSERLARPAVQGGGERRGAALVTREVGPLGSMAQQRWVPLVPRCQGLAGHEETCRPVRSAPRVRASRARFAGQQRRSLGQLADLGGDRVRGPPVRDGHRGPFLTFRTSALAAAAGEAHRKRVCARPGVDRRRSMRGSDRPPGPGTARFGLGGRWRS